MTTREICTGAPEGFQAECGGPGPHGTHDLVDANPAHPVGRLLRAIAAAVDDGLPAPYSIELHGPTFEMFVPSHNPDNLGALRQWGAYLGAEHAEEEPRGNAGRIKYTVCGTLPGGAGRITAWDAVDPPELRDVPTTKRVRNVPLEQLT